VSLRKYAGLGALSIWATAVVVVRSRRIEMPLFDFFVAAVSLVPLGLLLLFWGVFPSDCGSRPIYRESAIYGGPGGGRGLVRFGDAAALDFTFG
jgi:hypothetical protein